MAASDELKELNVRLKNLEAKLETVSRRNKVEGLSARDIAAYHKVQPAFWEDGTCGINETSPCILRCNVINQGKVIPDSGVVRHRMHVRALQHLRAAGQRRRFPVPRPRGLSLRDDERAAPATIN